MSSFKKIKLNAILKIMSQNNGFTLIELLVVIAIIGLLSSVVLSSLNSARVKAQNARRVSDIHAIQMAIEMYANDHEGNYPSTGGKDVCIGIPSSEQCWGGPYGDDALNLDLKPYLSDIPKDPLYGSRIYGTYVYSSPGYWWLPNSNATGTYSLAFETGVFPHNDNDCLGWKYAAWDGRPGPHCPVGGSCRQCGYLNQ